MNDDVPLSAEIDAGPECDLCGKTDCPDADLPGFSEPRDCIYRPVYEALRYDRCDYGCGRDITKDTIRRAIGVFPVPCTCGAQLVRPYPNDNGEHSTTECPLPPVKGDPS